MSFGETLGERPDKIIYPVRTEVTKPLFFHF